MRVRVKLSWRGLLIVGAAALGPGAASGGAAPPRVGASLFTSVTCAANTFEQITPGFSFAAVPHVHDGLGSVTCTGTALGRTVLASPGTVKFTVDGVGGCVSETGTVTITAHVPLSRYEYATATLHMTYTRLLTAVNITGTSNIEIGGVSAPARATAVLVARPTQLGFLACNGSFTEAQDTGVITLLGL